MIDKRSCIEKDSVRKNLDGCVKNPNLKHRFFYFIFKSMVFVLTTKPEATPRVQNIHASEDMATKKPCATNLLPACRKKPSSQVYLVLNQPFASHLRKRNSI